MIFRACKVLKIASGTKERRKGREIICFRQGNIYVYTTFERIKNTARLDPSTVAGLGCELDLEALPRYTTEHQSLQ